VTMTTAVKTGVTTGVMTAGVATAPCHREGPSHPALLLRGEASITFGILHCTAPMLG
jgi:hypothetical protein